MVNKKHERILNKGEFLWKQLIFIKHLLKNIRKIKRRIKITSCWADEKKISIRRRVAQTKIK